MTSSGWTRQRRCEYRQTTVQEPWGATLGSWQTGVVQHRAVNGVHSVRAWRVSTDSRTNATLMPDSQTARRQGRLDFRSLAELYETYERLFLQSHGWRQALDSNCGLQVVAFDRCFPHLVKLSRTDSSGPVTFFNIQEEKPRIRRVKEGWGAYSIDGYRARNLSSVLDTLLKPHHVYELADPQTAHLSFLKHYGDKPYPFMTVYVGWSQTDDCLFPVTGFPVKRNQARIRFTRARKLLWSVGDSPLESV